MVEDGTHNTYHPLDGTEMLKWILLDAGQKLSEFYEFGLAKVYHNPRYTITVKIESFDSGCSYVNSDDTVGVSGQKTPQPENNQVIDLIEKVVVEGPVTQPDKIRDQIKAGRYKTKQVSGILCDIKEEMKNASDSPTS